LGGLRGGMGIPILIINLTINSENLREICDIVLRGISRDAEAYRGIGTHIL